MKILPLINAAIAAIVLLLLAPAAEAAGLVQILPSGGDDTSAIAAAIGSGASVQLAPGDYEIGPLPALRGGQGIIGPSSKLTRLHREAAAAPGPLLSASSVDGIVLRGFALDGGSIAISGSADIEIDDVEVANSAGDCLTLDSIDEDGGAELSSLRKVRLVNCGGNGLSVSGFKNLEIVSSQFADNGGSGAIFAAEPSQGLMLRDVWATGNSGHGVAILCVTSGNPDELSFPITDVVISGFFAEGNGAYGVIAQAARGVVTGGVALSNGYAGGTFGLSGILINSDRMAVVGTGSFSNGGDGIDAGGANEPAIVGNIVDWNGYWGIEGSSVQNGNISANIASNNFQADAAHALTGPYAAGIFHGTGYSNPGDPFATVPNNTVIGLNRVTSGPNQTYGIVIPSQAWNDLLIGNDVRNAGQGAGSDLQINEPTTTAIGNLTR